MNRNKFIKKERKTFFGNTVNEEISEDTSV